MSNLGPFRGSRQQPRLPTPPRGTPIARYATYLEAQRAVDFLSDSHFAVQNVTIVGTDLRMVERVTGRLTYSRVALAGTLSGAWFGLFVGIVLSLFATGASIDVLTAMLIGAGFGMLFAVTSYALTGGRRDFTSTSQIVASEYLVLCLEEQAATARELLARLPHARPGPEQASADLGSSVPPPWAPPPVPPPGHTTTDPSSRPESSSPAEPSGPTYGEMIERQRQERLAREAQQRAESEQPGQE